MHTFITKTGKRVTVAQFLQGPRLHNGYVWLLRRDGLWLEVVAKSKPTKNKPCK